MALLGANVAMVTFPPGLRENVLAWILLAVVMSGLTPVDLLGSEYSFHIFSIPQCPSSNHIPCDPHTESRCSPQGAPAHQTALKETSP